MTNIYKGKIDAYQKVTNAIYIKDLLTLITAASMAY